MHVCRMCLSYNIQDQHASIAIMIIINVKYKNVGNTNNLSKCIMSHLWLRRVYKTLLYSHQLSTYLQLRQDKIQFFKKIHKNWVYCCMQLVGTCIFSRCVHHKGLYRIKVLCVLKKTESYLSIMVDKLIFSDYIKSLGHYL